MPYVNIALDIFGIVITLIIFVSCLFERIKNEIKSNGFLILMLFEIIALLGDVIAWTCEGKPELCVINVIGNTIATCFAYFTIFVFMVYLKKNLYGRSRAMTAVVSIFGILCVATVIVMIFNACFGFAFGVNDEGHYVHIDEHLAFIMCFAFPMLAFVASILMSIMARTANLNAKISYSIYAVVPTVGVILDYSFHGWSFTYAGLVVSTVIIYTNIYLQKRRLIESQRVSLMMSQINPHFMYNTLNTVASLCDTNPKSAKHLIVDFSTYLRRNLDTLTTTELIPFEQELNHVECYLKIEKARFMDRVNIIYSIQCKNFDLPALTVQPIVENAIKHGITKKTEGGTVRISTYATEDSCVVEIKDDGVGFDTEAKINDTREHIGIANVRSRLRDMCRGTLTVKSMVGVGTRVTIEIPKRKVR